MKLLSIVLTAALLPLSLITAQAASLSQSDSDYLNSAMSAQLGRFALASLAEKQASSAQVKSLAASIASQSSTATRALETLAKTYGVAPAKGPPVQASYQYSQLSDLHGSQFDSRFIQELKIDDDTVSSDDQSEAQGGRNTQLKSFAKQRYAALQNEQKKLNSIH